MKWGQYQLSASRRDIVANFVDTIKENNNMELFGHLQRELDNFVDGMPTVRREQAGRMTETVQQSTSIFNNGRAEQVADLIKTDKSGFKGVKNKIIGIVNPGYFKKRTKIIMEETSSALKLARKAAEDEQNKSESSVRELPQQYSTGRVQTAEEQLNIGRRMDTMLHTPAETKPAGQSERLAQLTNRGNKLNHIANNLTDITKVAEQFKENAGNINKLQNLGNRDRNNGLQPFTL